MNTPPKINSPSSKFDIMSHNTVIDAALDDLESQDIIDYAKIARSYNINRITLINRYKGILTSRQADEELATSPVSSLCIMYRRCVSSNLTRLLAIRLERRRHGGSSLSSVA